MDRVEVRGLQIAYRRAGRGPPLMLVHGAPGDGRVWGRQLDDLADSFDVIAWDAPGCGESEDPPESFRLPDYADALAGLIATLDLGRPHVLGHSFGGALVLELYRWHPSVPATLILTGGYAGWAGSLPRDEVDRRLRFALDVADRLPGGFEPASMRGLFSEAISREAAAELAAIMSEARPVATRAMAYALTDADLRSSLPAIDVPTLLLQGEVDERSSVGVAQELHRAIPNAQLHVLTGLGHVCFLEDPERFDAAVRDFLRSPARG